MRRKIVVITGSRSEYGILKPVLNNIIASEKLKLYLVVAGMHLLKKHGFTVNEIIKDGYNIHSKIKMSSEGDTNYDMAKRLGRGMIQFADVFKKIKPDMILILGDRDEALASAMVASHMNIPVAHIHGGDKSKAGIDEYNRHAITKMSNIHFTASRKSFQRVLNLGENPKFVFYTGSPGIDDIFQKNITNKKELEKKYDIKFTGREILLVYHPVTTEIEMGLKHIKNILKVIAKLKEVTVVIAPNSDAGNKQIFQTIENFSSEHKHIKFYKNLPRSDYLGLLNNCAILIGNSSSGMIEAGYFDIRVINIGIRQNEREHGANVVNISPTMKKIEREILNLLKIRKPVKKLNVYGDGNASKKITKILETITLDKELIQKQITY